MEDCNRVRVPNAQECFDRTRDSVRAKFVSKVNSAVDKGLYRVVYKFCIPEWFKEELLENGFKISKEEDLIVISWEE